jgi:hypothetical protein
MAPGLKSLTAENNPSPTTVMNENAKGHRMNPTSIHTWLNCSATLI